MSAKGLLRGFNPHRPAKAGAARIQDGGLSIPCRCFNPHRPAKAGAALVLRSVLEFLHGFNPHRPAKAGAARRRSTPGLVPTVFQSSPAREGRCCRDVKHHHVCCAIVSILTGPRRPVLRHVPNRLVWLGLFPRMRGPSEWSLPPSKLAPHTKGKYLLLGRLEATRSSPGLGVRFRFALKLPMGHRI